MSRQISYDVKFRASLDASRISGAGSTVSRELRQSAQAAQTEGQKMNAAAQETAKSLRQQRQEFRQSIRDHQQALNSYASTVNTVRRSTADFFPAIAKQATDAGTKIKGLYTEFETLRRMITKMKGSETDSVGQMLQGLVNQTRGVANWTRNLRSDSLFKQIEIDEKKRGQRASKGGSFGQYDFKNLERDMAGAETAALNLQKAFARLGEGGRKGFEDSKRLFESIRGLRQDYAQSSVTDKYAKTQLDGLKKAGSQIKDTLNKQQSDAVEINQQGGKKSGNAFIGSFRGALVGMATGMAIGFAMDFVQTVGTQIVSAFAKGMEYERITRSLGAVSLTAAETRQQISDLNALAAKTPGLTFESALVGQQRLRAVNFAMEESKMLLEGLAKQKLLSGGTDDDVNRVLVNLQQIKSTGVVTQREIKEILHALPTVADAMERAFGTTSARQIEALGISGSRFIRELNKEMANTKSIAGDSTDAWEKLVSQVYQSQKAFADPALPALTETFRKLTLALSESEAMFASWGSTFSGILDMLNYGMTSGLFNDLNEGFWKGANQATMGNAKYLRLLGTAVGETYDWMRGRGNYELMGNKALGKVNPNLSEEEQLKIARANRRQYLDDKKSMLAEEMRAEELRLTRTASMTQEGERELSQNLLGLKAKGMQDLYAATEESWKRQIELNKDNENVRLELERLAGKDLASLRLANELELTKILREQAAERIRIAQMEAQLRRDTGQSFYDLETAEERGRINSADTSTPGATAKNNAERYQLALRDLEQKRKLLLDETNTRLSGIDVNSDEGRRGWTDYWNKIRSINAEELRLKAERNNQLKQENKNRYDEAAKDANVRAFFSALSKIEGGGLYTVVGGAQANKNDARHPGAYGMGMQGPAGWSTASGLWQITQSNWNRLKGTLNLTDFRDPEQQLKVALYLFQEASKLKGVDGIGALMSGNFELAAKAGTQPWAASPFSTLPGRKRSDFLGLISKGSSNGIFSGGTDFNPENDSETLTKAERDARMLNQIEIYRRGGIQPPDELFNQYLAYTNERQRQSGGYQQTAEELRAQTFAGATYFSTERQRWFTPTQDPNEMINGVPVGSFATTRERFAKGSKEAYLQPLREERTAEEEKLRARTAAFEEEIAIAVERQANARKNDMLDLESELRLLAAQNTQEEVLLELKRQQVNQRRELTETMRDLAVLAEQQNNAEFVSERRELAARKEQLDLARQLADIEDQTANMGRNAQLELQVALAQQQLDIRRAELDAVIDIHKARVDIARMDEFSANQAGARILAHLGQQRNLTDAIADAWIDIYDSVNDLAATGIDKLTAGMGIFKGAVGGLLKFGVSSFTTKVTTSLLDTLMPGLGTQFAESSNPVMAGLQKQDKQIDLLTQIRDNTSGGFGGGARLGGGNPFRMPSLPGLLGSVLSGGAFPLTPGFNPNGGGNIVGQDGQMIAPDTSTRARIVGGMTGGGGFLSRLGGLSNLFSMKSLGGMLSSFAASAPLMGMGLGASLGGSSITGSILGGGGGLLAGAGILGSLMTLAPGLMGGVAGILGPGLAGTLMAAGPFALAAAPLLLIGGWLLGRNKRRRQEEKIRTQFKSDALGQMDKLISDLRGHRISGADALSRMDEIRAAYVEQAGQLKDRKTRRIALNELNPPNALWAKMEEVKRYAGIRSASEERARQIVPEFATGGKIFGRQGGMLARIGEAGYDEYVLSTDPRYRSQTMNLLGDFMRQTQMAGMNNQPAASSQQSAVTSAPQGPVKVVLSAPVIDAEGMLRQSLNVYGVKKELLEIVQEGLNDGSVRTNG